MTTLSTCRTLAGMARCLEQALIQAGIVNADLADEAVQNEIIEMLSSLAEIADILEPIMPPDAYADAIQVKAPAQHPQPLSSRGK